MQYHGHEVERLQKILARAGIASRRKCEEYITTGRVTVDGAVVRELGVKVDPAQSEVRCDGERVRAEPPVYFLVNKPSGFVCSNSADGERGRVVDLVRGIDQRLFTVGRLDVDSEGLVIVTNDGEFANRLAHPRYGVQKVYLADIDGAPLSDAEIAKLKRGVHLAEGIVRFSGVSVRRLGRERSCVRVALREGMNREIRRAFAALGRPVRRLRRIAIGRLSDPELESGAYRKLSAAEFAMLHEDTGLVSPDPNPNRNPNPAPRSRLRL